MDHIPDTQADKNYPPIQQAEVHILRLIWKKVSQEYPDVSWTLTVIRVQQQNPIFSSDTSWGQGGFNELSQTTDTFYSKEALGLYYLTFVETPGDEDIS